MEAASFDQCLGKGEIQIVKKFLQGKYYGFVLQQGERMEEGGLQSVAYFY